MPARKRRRGRSGKPRRAPRPQTESAAAQPQRERAPASRRVARERPRAPWHPLPLSELLILVGGGAVLFALANGPAQSVAALLAGLAAVVIGTLEVTLREHFSGYRSHALLLALVAVAVLHTAIVLVVSAFASFPRTANVALLVLDLAVAFVLFRFLRARYLEARRRDALARR
jgi:lysylphosphatidylglycerol synthetase-like protein (DUF2156 family)